MIRGAQSAVEGVAAGYKYLVRATGPGLLREQTSVSNGVRFFDKLHIDLMDGRSLAAYFDITDFAGR